MEYKQIIDKLVRELSFRVGVPNIHNKEHQSIMSEILSEWGEYDVKQTIFEFLTEEPRKFKNPILNRTVKYKDKRGNEKEGIIGNLLTSPKDSPGRIAAEKMLPADGTSEREAINKEVGSQGTQKKIDSPKGDSTNTTDDTKTTQGSSLKSKSYQKRVKKEKEVQQKLEKEKESKSDGETKPKEKNKTLKQDKEFDTSLDKTISQMREKRKQGIAGAGGQAASFGESVYADNVSSLDINEFQKENEKEINSEIENIEKKKLTVEQKRVLKNMGLNPPPDKEGVRYLATREVFFKKELEKAKKDKPNHVFYQKPGFEGKESSFRNWMNAAFDGAVSTREMLDEGGEIDTSKPFKGVQSDKEVDTQVLKELERKRDSAKTDEEREHYDREIYFFKKSGTYHDTYVVGVDNQGRMTVVSITNKADSALKDPHNNTTPANRLAVLEGKYDEKTQKVVIGTIKEGIERVTNVTEDTKKNSAKLEIDENFAKLARIAGPKYFKEIDKRGTNRKKTKAGGPARGAEFGHFLDEEKVSVEDWNSMSDVDKIKLVQKYNANNDVSYDPYAKLFIKVGEVDTGGHRQLLKVRAEAEKQGIDLTASNLRECGDIKRNEQGAVKETHEKVVNTIYDADKKDGFPKTDANGNVVENGPAAKAYIDTVLDSLHFTSYIDFDDKDDNKLIAQMGIRGAKPSDVRKCLGDLSGYGDIPPGNREGLKEYLRNTSTVDADTGAIIIKSKKNGQVTQLAEDTWRTAGTSQKVASSFGKDMQECIGNSVDSRRSSK